MTLFSLIIFIIIFLTIVYLIKKIANGPMNPLKKDLSDKFIIVTGSSDGIGIPTAKDLLNSNAKVIFACRNKEKTMKVINNLPDNLKSKATFISLNLASFKSIENFAKEIKSNYPKIDILVNNAGILANNVSKTEDGYIDTFQVNYLGTVLLTLLLLDHFNEKESKIINVGSRAYKISILEYGDSKYLNDYNLMYEHYLKIRNKHRFYGNTKLLLLFFTQYLADLFDKKFPYLKIVFVHPGVVLSNIVRPKRLIGKILFNLLVKPIAFLRTKDVLHGAQTTLFCCYSDNKELINGGYYNNIKIEAYIDKAKDEKLRKEMVNETLSILKDKYSEFAYLPKIE